MRTFLKAIILSSLFIVMLVSCAPVERPGNTMNPKAILSAPVANKVPHTMSDHGVTRSDPYYWMRDDERKNQDVLDYLLQENAFTDSKMAHTESAQAALFDELSARIKPDDNTVPVRHGDYEYWLEYKQDQEYPHYRRRLLSDSQEETILDVNSLAEPFEYYNVGTTQVSDNGKWLAYTEDSVSRGEYVLRFKNLENGETLATKIPMVSGSLAWASDNQTVYYVQLQDETLIPYKVFRHQLGSNPKTDEMVYHEKDSTNFMWLTRTRDGQHVLVASTSTLSTEMQLIDADDPAAQIISVLPREANHEYYVEPQGENVYILSNWQATNFRLLKAPISSASDKSTWKEVIANDENALLSNFQVFNDFIAFEKTEDGINTITIQPTNGSDSFVIDSDEAVYSATLDNNPNMDSNVFRYRYESLATPDSIIDYDVLNGDKKLRKQVFAGVGFESSHYETKRIYTTARDGTQVPVSLLYKKGLKADGSNPIYVLGYGAYGVTYEPGFRSQRFSLVDRGFVFALAHIRGGQEKGRAWYEDGKLLNKKNTFTDFIDVTDDLVKRGWGHPDKVVGTGRSAGGLLIGAVANMAPESYTILLTEVPFVDVITTMLDESIPLTTFEFDEWGNPKDKIYHDYMLSYSPYDQVEKKNYPHMLVSTGLWDSAVQYWEPAKWVAKLRDYKTDQNRLLFYTDMNAGHSGSAGRFKRQKDYARKYAFVFDILDIEI